MYNRIFQADGTGTVAKEDRLHESGTTTIENGTKENAIADVPINENLFLDDDLEGLDEELNDLELEDQ